MKKDKLRQYYHRYFKRGFSGITASSRVFPDFIIIGTVRSGTTSLYYNICKHKSILPAAYDEIGFFDSTQKEMRNIEISTGNSITGEDTPFYFWKEEVADRIKKLLPETKLIGIFRNPVDRAYSNYNLSVRMNVEKLTFEDAINKEMNSD